LHNPERRLLIDKHTKREMRLAQLEQKLVSGAITDAEEQEYKLLQEEQSAELNDAITWLAKKQTRFRLPRFLRRKS
jgi:hypothetical protein